MSRKKSGLQKDIRTIFYNSHMPAEACQGQHPGQHDPHDAALTDHSIDQISDPAVQERQEAFFDDDEVIEYDLEPEQTIEDRIRLMMESVPCEKDFICYRSEFEQLCQIRSIGDGRLIECLEKREKHCRFRMAFHGKEFCKCSIRQYIARETGK